MGLSVVDMVIHYCPGMAAACHMWAVDLEM